VFNENGFESKNQIRLLLSCVNKLTTIAELKMKFNQKREKELEIYINVQKAKLLFDCFFKKTSVVYDV